MKRLCEEQPDLYLDEYVEKLIELGYGYYTVNQVHAALKSLGMTRKKLDRRSLKQKELERKAYKYIVSTIADPAQLLFMDEKSKNRYSARRCFGRATGGKRAHIIDEYARSGQYGYTFIGAVDIDGYVTNACGFYWRPRPRGQEKAGEELAYTNITLDVFEKNFEYLVVPHLGNFELGEPRSVVVMDNASWHNSQRICNMVEARGAQLIYTPVCSPDLNPIEFTFSKYAAYLRRNAVSPIGAPDEIRCLVKDMHHAAMEQVTRADMIGIYQHCGFIANLPDS